MDTEVTERPVDDAPPAPPTDHGDQGMVISWQAGRSVPERNGHEDRKKEPKPSRRQRRAERRAAKREVEPLFPEFADLAEATFELGPREPEEAAPVEQSVPEPPVAEVEAAPVEQAPPEPRVVKPRAAKPRVVKPKPAPVEVAEPDPPVAEVESPPVDDVAPPDAPVVEESTPEPEPEPVAEVEHPPTPKPRAKPKLSVPTPPRVRQGVPEPVPQPVLAEPAIEDRPRRRFSVGRVLAAVFVGAVLAAAVMVALVAAPDLLRERGGGPNVATLSVRSERPVPTSRRFTVTVSNRSDHSVVAACTASVTNPDGTREVAKSRFAVGPIPADGTASYEGRLRWVGKKAKMAPGIAVGCNEESA